MITKAKLPAILGWLITGIAVGPYAFSNMIPEEQLEEITKAFNPILGVSMIIVILNLGAPLDYHAVFGAGIYTFIYIAVRAA